MLPSVSATSPVHAGEFIQWEGAVTAAEIAAIEEYGDRLTRRKADLAGGTANDGIRITSVAWLERKPEIEWLYRRMEDLVLHLNTEFFRYELFGLTEDFQYAVYDSSQNSHFDWHNDIGNIQVEPRKISLSLQLSHENAYQGCDLELHSAGHVQPAPRTRGTLIAFPSYLLHRVTPIRAGVRKSLVVWAAGPKFR
ncbi:MAG TPA: 2OG-Fe(II) oxygenase [Rhizomicrobium sp.]|jgi:PKHD-type hydroxylase|nr:2OG-Fe(II) oxygenase [Rhizomicrobium sp.]